MKLKPIRIALREDGMCVCGNDPANIKANADGRFFCPRCGREFEEEKPKPKPEPEAEPKPEAESEG